MSLSAALLPVGILALVVGTGVVFACAARGVALQRSIGMLVDPVSTARRHGRVVVGARIGLLVATFGLGLLVASGVWAIFEAIAAAT